MVDAFLHGLADLMNYALVVYDLPQTLEGVIELATRVDLPVQICHWERPRGHQHLRPSP